MDEKMLTLPRFEEASEIVKKVTLETKLVYSDFLSERYGNKIYLKPENMQFTGAYKVRGAYYAMSTLSDEQRSKGVITASAGNHAQGVAYAAKCYGVKATIVMPTTTPLMKVNRTKSYGAEVVLWGDVYDEACAKAYELADEKGYTFIHPFNDLTVATGQGTIAMEIFKEQPLVDYILVPIGGGGLIAGLAYAVKNLRPQCRIIGVQAAGAPSMAESLKEGKIITLSSVDTVADGIKVKTPGDLTFDMCREYVDEVVTVSEGEIASAILTVLEKQKLVAEGAGAVGIAAAMYHKASIEGQTVCALLSGGNVDVTMLERILTRGLAKEGRTVSFSTVLPDQPHALASFLEVVSSLGANVLDVNHERRNTRAAIGSCVVQLSLETRDKAHIQEIISSLRREGYEVEEQS